MLEFKYSRFKDRLILCQDVLDLITKFDCYLAGGALRGCFGKNEVVDDYDVFFKNSLQAANIKIELEDLGYKIVFVCPAGKLTTLKSGNIKVQLITEIFYDSPQELIDTFDFNAARIAYSSGIIYTDRSAIRDVRRKRLTIHRMDFPASTFKRIVKYTKKGYTLPNETISWFLQDVRDKILAGLALDERFYID